jgi:hypothetical protein
MPDLPDNQWLGGGAASADATGSSNVTQPSIGIGISAGPETGSGLGKLKNRLGVAS